MAVKETLHMARPLAPATVGVQPTTAPLTAIIQPQVKPPRPRDEGTLND